MGWQTQERNKTNELIRQKLSMVGLNPTSRLIILPQGVSWQVLCLAILTMQKTFSATSKRRIKAPT